MLVELHTHTKYSHGTKIFVEGLNTPEEMVAHAKKIGLGAIAITDHDEIKGIAQAKKLAKKYGIIVIPGEEINSCIGHILAIGIEEFIKPGMTVDETIDAIHSQGGIAIGVHPFDIKNAGIGELAKKTDAIEIFNALNMERVTNRRAKKFAELHKMPQVAGSDAHWTEMVGYGVNEIDADDADSIIRAVRKGDAKVRGRYMPASIIMRWAVTRLKLSYPYTLNYINSNYSWPKRIISRNMLGLVKRSPGKIDYFLNSMGYIGMGSAVIYGFMKNLTR
jgi:predicted metal-dependent phosphoesterase TrpH